MAQKKMFSFSHVLSIADLPPPVAICCHDAGGANLIAPWVASEPSLNFRICVEGPARTIFADVASDHTTRSLSDALQGARCLLSGSGWASNLEHESRTAARSLGIPVIAVLDHWVNYRMRFTRRTVETLPDAFVVTDRHAAALAAETFGNLMPIMMWDNRYLQNEMKKVRRYSHREVNVPPTRLLILLEPVRKDWITDAAEPAEFRALDHLMKNVTAISPRPAEMAIRLRPHPSESASKYVPWLRRQIHPQLEMSEGHPLAEDLAWADMTAGLESYSMIVALECGRRAVCYLPADAPRCSLRHFALEYLDDLIESMP